MSTETYTAIAISTAHLSAPSTAYLDELAASSWDQMIFKRDTGWFCKLYEEITCSLGSMMTDPVKIGALPDLVMILAYAHRQGARMIEFDADAEIIDELPLAEDDDEKREDRWRRRAQREHLRTRGNYCPSCLSPNIDPPDGVKTLELHDNAKIEGSVSCNACGATWQHVYRLESFVETSPGQLFDVFEEEYGNREQRNVKPVRMREAQDMIKRLRESGVVGELRMVRVEEED